MTRKFNNKYRTTSHRMPKWDYSGNGIYFITMVTQNRECNLGRIRNNEIILSEFGQIVLTEWLKSVEIRTELFLDEWIIMPNHLHAIIVLDKPIMQNDESPVETHGHVETHGRVSLQSNGHATQQQPSQPFIRKPKSVSSFIAGFKSATNSKIDDLIDERQLDIPKYNRNNHFWQPNYYDLIIRNDRELKRIQHYIVNNPLNWQEDELFDE